MSESKNKDLLDELKKAHETEETPEKDYSALGTNRAERRKLKKNAAKFKNAK